MCRRFIPADIKTQILAYRADHSISETSKAFHVCWNTVKRIAPTSRAETSLRCSYAQKVRHERLKIEKEIRRAKILEEQVKQKRAEIADLRGEIALRNDRISAIEHEIEELVKAI